MLKLQNGTNANKWRIEDVGSWKLQGLLCNNPESTAAHNVADTNKQLLC